MSLMTLGLVAIAAAQPPAQPVKPATYTPDAPGTVRVEPSQRSADGSAQLPKALTAARAAVVTARDYTAILVRTERVNGTLRPEQTCELRVRTKPFAVNVKVTGPQPVAGQETSFVSDQNLNRVRFKPAGPAGVKFGFRTLPKDDPQVLTDARHPVTEVGLAAVLDRVEQALAMEKRLNHPVTVTTATATHADRPATRFDIYLDHPHPHRTAARMVLVLDPATKLPVRFEAYDAPKLGASDGPLLEASSFLGTRVNVGLGDNAFAR
jgi:hypothetical protein